ncbi:MAG: hypothetical protein HOP06_06510 [Methylotenera sp.]|nr:hypothetical protein [Methylotenera sp.]
MASYRISTGEHVRSRTIQHGLDSYVVHYKDGGVDDDAINTAIHCQAVSTDFFKQLARMYADLDHIHAFNEANSRTLRVFIEQFVSAGGYYQLDWTKLEGMALANYSVRDTLYMARDLEVSRRSFPNLTITNMRDASPSEFEAYETQKKIRHAFSMSFQDLTLQYLLKGILDHLPRLPFGTTNLSSEIMSYEMLVAMGLVKPIQPK